MLGGGSWCIFMPSERYLTNRRNLTVIGKLFNYELEFIFVNFVIKINKNSDVCVCVCVCVCVI